jgi:hypothetical protein
MVNANILKHANMKWKGSIFALIKKIANMAHFSMYRYRTYGTFEMCTDGLKNILKYTLTFSYEIFSQVYVYLQWVRSYVYNEIKMHRYPISKEDPHACWSKQIKKKSLHLVATAQKW